MSNWLQKIIQAAKDDEHFLELLESAEKLVAKVLSVGMIAIVLVSLVNLGWVIYRALSMQGDILSTRKIFELFGLFLNVLIALEILENITAYLKKQVVQVELVIVTSLIAVSRKIIILDLEKTAGIDLIALAAAIVALSVSYWLLRRSNRDQ